MRAGRRTNRGEYAAAVLVDLRKCYVHVSHILLARAAHELSYPLCLLRRSMASYTWPRFIMYQNTLACTLWATTSIIAGAAFATFELRCLQTMGLRMFSMRNREVSLDVIIDDATVAAGNESI